MAPDATPVVEVEKFLGERLPPSAQNMRAAGERGIDQAMFLSFDAASDEVTVFSQRLQLPLTAGDDASMALRNPGLDWWSGPVDANGPEFRGGIVSHNSSNRHIQMLAISLPDGRERVWLAAHSN